MEFNYFYRKMHIMNYILIYRYSKNILNFDKSKVQDPNYERGLAHKNNFQTPGIKYSKIFTSISFESHLLYY